MQGVLAGFESEQALLRALNRLAAERLEDLDTYTPMPLDEAAAGSPLPLVMFAAGMLGFIGAFLLMAYADVYAYPQNIGGRPNFAWPAFIPIAFEIGVLCAMGAGFFGYFVACQLPRLYEPIDECDGFRRASRDGWCVAIRSSDPQVIARLRSLLDELHPASVEEFGE